MRRKREEKRKREKKREEKRREENRREEKRLFVTHSIRHHPIVGTAEHVRIDTKNKHS